MTNESKRDWENFFKPEDFNDGPDKEEFKCLGWPQPWFAAIANEIIRKELEKAQTVWKDKNAWDEFEESGDKFTAKLVCIKEINNDRIPD